MEHPASIRGWWPSMRRAASTLREASAEAQASTRSLCRRWGTRMDTWWDSDPSRFLRTFELHVTAAGDHVDLAGGLRREAAAEDRDAGPLRAAHVQDVDEALCDLDVLLGPGVERRARQRARELRWRGEVGRAGRHRVGGVDGDDRAEAVAAGGAATVGLAAQTHGAGGPEDSAAERGLAGGVEDPCHVVRDDAGRRERGEVRTGAGRERCGHRVAELEEVRRSAFRPGEVGGE